jgi:glyoxylase-like metal-dependent hydrolase (beta-lactamase superfamily II)
MRVVAVHEDVLVATSAFWQTTCTLVRSGDEAFVIDSPVLPSELEALPAVAEQGGFRVVGLLATHADFDHVLGRYAFASLALGVGETTAARLRAEPGAAQRMLRGWDDQNYVQRPGPLSLGEVQALPVPGKLELGSEGAELELHPADGHTVDGTAFVVPWAGALVCGDYLSPVEIPWLSEDGGSVSAYLATLARFEPLVSAVETVIPGHGAPLPSARAAAILAEDRAYLEALIEHGAGAPLPEGRRTRAQRKIHAENAGRLKLSGS